MNRAANLCNRARHIMASLLGPFNPPEIVTGGIRSARKLIKNGIIRKKKLGQKCSFWIYSGKFKVISLRFLEVILNIYGIFLMIFRFLSANFQISSCKFSDFFLQIFKFFKYGHFGPKRPVFGRFWGPPVTFPGGLKGSIRPPWM